MKFISALLLPISAQHNKEFFLTHSDLVLPVSKKAVRAWMLFDWAAQPFFTVVITFIFGPYFVARLASDPVVGQAAWGYTVTIAGIAIALMAPFSAPSPTQPVRANVGLLFLPP